MSRGRHPRGEVEDALVEAEAAGWLVEQTASGHRWGRMLCGESSRAGCQVSIWSTPRSAGNHGKQIRRAVQGCPHEWEREEA